MISPYQQIPDLNSLKQSYPHLKGLFFDMDGTLFDTEKYHEKALQSIGLQYQIRPPHPPEVIHEMMVGKADHFIFDIVRTWENFPQHWQVTDFVAAKNSHLLQLLRNSEAHQFFPQKTLALIEAARQQNLFLALVTSSEKVVTSELLKLTGLATSFDLILTRDDCPLHKPHPWPYLEALKSSDCHAHEIVIFEDSPVGLEAAVKSGAHVIKVEWF